MIVNLTLVRQAEETRTKRTIEIAEINLILHQEEAAEDNINSADDANDNASEKEEDQTKKI